MISLVDKTNGKTQHGEGNCERNRLSNKKTNQNPLIANCQCATNKHYVSVGKWDSDSNVIGQIAVSELGLLTCNLETQTSSDKDNHYCFLPFIQQLDISAQK